MVSPRSDSVPEIQVQAAFPNEGTELGDSEWWWRVGILVIYCIYYIPWEPTFPSFLAVITHILCVQNLHFSWFLGVQGYTVYISLYL